MSFAEKGKVRVQSKPTNPWFIPVATQTHQPSVYSGCEALEAPSSLKAPLRGPGVDEDVVGGMGA